MKNTKVNSRYWIVLLICSLTQVAVKAQDKFGNIQGTVLTADNSPAVNVSVLIQSPRLGTVTDNEGAFKFRRLKPGQYTVQISLLGHETQEKVISVEAGKTAAVALSLLLSENQLKEVIITGNQNRFGQRESDAVARLPISNLENPQAYSVISKELMQEQITVDYKDALRNTPGAAVGYGNVFNGVTYLILRGFWVTSQVRNGMGAQQNGGIDPVNVERVEVLKGPSGTLFGSSLINFGGFSNLVTKKPFDAFKGEVSYTVGSWNLNRLTADINTPLNKDKSLLMRVNAAVQSNNTFQTYGVHRSFAIAPSLSYKVNDRLTLSIDAELYKIKRNTNPVFGFTNTTFKNISQVPLDYFQSITTNDPMLDQGNMNLYAEAKYKISGNWTSSTQFSTGNTVYDNVNTMWPNPWMNDSMIIRNFVGARGSVYQSRQFQQNFTGDFHIGRFRHRLVAGAEMYFVENKVISTLTMPYDTINVRYPIKQLSMDRINQMVAQSDTLTQATSRQYRYAAYVSDVLNFTDYLSLMLSLRIERFENKGTSTNGQPVAKAGVYGQTSISPKLGIVYQPVKDVVSVFANYMNGYQNVAPITQGGELFVPKPQYGNQWEIGAKADAFNHKLSGTISYYNITLSNVLRPDPAQPTIQIQDGTQRSTGFEADIIANPVDGLNIVAGYGYNTYKYTKASKALEGTGTGLPAHLANWWISYRFPANVLKGLGLGLGGNYVSTVYPNNESGLLTIPEYTKFDATIFYDQPKFRVGLKVNNITDERYWGVNNDPQNPRQVVANLSFKF